MFIIASFLGLVGGVVLGFVGFGVGYYVRGKYPPTTTP